MNNVVLVLVNILLYLSIGYIIFYLIMNVFIHLIFKVEYKWEFDDNGWPKLVRKYIKRY